MELVRLSLYAEAQYTGREYSEELLISKELYEKIQDELESYDSGENSEKIFVGELNGKHSSVYGRVSIVEYSEHDLDNIYDLDKDGRYLYYEVNSICNGKKLNLDADIEEVTKYMSTVDSLVEVTITVRKSNIEKLKDFANTL